jgi:hypothetical protein
MFELTINGVVYEFNFGMGFMREINRLVGTPVDGLPDVKKNIGLQYYVAGIIDGDLEALVTALDLANKGRKPRVTTSMLDAYIDDEGTDIDKLFGDVLDFLKNANATKKTVANLLAAIEAQQEATKK